MTGNREQGSGPPQARLAVARKSHQLSALGAPRRVFDCQRLAARPSALAGAPVASCQPPVSTFRSAFTLIEVLIVVGIIGLLLALAIPAVTRALENQKRTTTLGYMKVIESAIAKFEQAKPLGDKYGQTNGIPYFGHLPPDYFLWQPTPPIQWEAKVPGGDANLNGVWEPGEPVDGNDQANPNDEGHRRYNPVHLEMDFPDVAYTDGVRRRINGSWQPDPPPNSSPVQENYRSIESLYLYMTRLCPECKQILATGLPPKIVTNRDVCSGGPCPEQVIFGLDPLDKTKAASPGEPVDLMEIRDAWDRPLRYQVNPSRYARDPDDPNNSTRTKPSAWSWELRSAGPDGVFASDPTAVPPNYSGMFLPANKSGDDVILQGQ